jgi:hypothetical protein
MRTLQVIRPSRTPSRKRFMNIIAWGSPWVGSSRLSLSERLARLGQENHAGAVNELLRDRSAGTMLRLMFDKLFRRRPAPADEDSTMTLPADLAARAKAAADLIGPGAMSVAMSERGVHVESLLVALGAVAGYACQVAAWISPPPAAIRDESTVRGVEVRGADGRSYFLADAINHYLLESPMSVWNVAAGVIPQLSARALPDVAEIVQHVASSIGTESFGAIRFPPGTSAGHPPSEYLSRLWPTTREKLDQSGLSPAEWSIAFGIAGQIMLFAARDTVEPTIALAILIETAVAMAKIDPAPLSITRD